MKEATGELNMTVITIIMIGAVLAFFWFFWDQIKGTLGQQWGKVNQETEKEIDGKIPAYHYSEEQKLTVTNQETTYTMTW